MCWGGGGGRGEVGSRDLIIKCGGAKVHSLKIRQIYFCLF